MPSNLLLNNVPSPKNSNQSSSSVVERNNLKNIKRYYEEDHPREVIDDRQSVFHDSEELPNEESVYVSRKLLIRQLVNHELKNSGLISSKNNVSISDVRNGDADDDRRSIADSWSELEENFSKIYEPVPFDVRMNSWRKMSKKQILAKVNSKKLVEELKSLSLSEILERIESLRENAYVSSDYRSVLSDTEERNDYARQDTFRGYTNNNIPADRVYKNNEKSQLKSDYYYYERKPRGKHLEEPCEPSYISRSEILSQYVSKPENQLPYVSDQFEKIENESYFGKAYTPISRKAIINNATKESNLLKSKLTRKLSSISGKSTSYFSKQELLSEIAGKSKEKKINGRELMENQHKPDDISARESNGHIEDSKEKFAKVFDAFVKLEELTKNETSTTSISDDVRQINPRSSKVTYFPPHGRKKLADTNITPPPLINGKKVYLTKGQSPVPCNEDFSRDVPSLNSQGPPVGIGFHNNGSEKRLDTESEVKCSTERNVETNSSEALVNEKNINLGFIYVPMHINETMFGDSDGSKDPTDYDTLSSLDSLMFEPKQLKFSNNKEDNNSDLSPDRQMLLNPSGNMEGKYSSTMTHLVTNSQLTTTATDQGFKNANIRYSKNDENDSSSFSTGEGKSPSNSSTSKRANYYHPDVSKEDLLITDTGSGESEISDSEMESLTSVESVIPNKKAMNQSIKVEDKKKNYKKYIVNNVDSDTNSEQCQISSITTQDFLDSDTSWDYLDSQRIKVGNSKDEITSFYMRYNNVKEDPTLRSNCPRSIGGTLIYENCVAVKDCQTSKSNVVSCNERSIICEKLKGIQTTTPMPSAAKEKMEGELSQENTVSSRDSGSTSVLNSQISPCELSTQHTSNASQQPETGTDYDSFNRDDEGKLLKEIRKIDSDECIFSNDSDQCHKLSNDSGINLLSDESLMDSLEPITIKSPDNVSVSTTGASLDTFDKMKKVQKLGVSLVGFENSNVMIKELKNKLKMKFSSTNDDQRLLSPDKNEDFNLPEMMNKEASLVAQKREELGPKINKIFGSLLPKSRNLESASKLTLETKEIDGISNVISSKLQTPKITSFPSVGEHHPITLSKNETQFSLQIPTPDYTPLSTLHRNELDDETLDDSLVPLYVATKDDKKFDIQGFVKMQLNSACGKRTESHYIPNDKIRNDKNVTAKRSVRFDISPLPPPPPPISEEESKATWSDLESIIFAGDSSLSIGDLNPGYCPSSALIDPDPFSLANLPETRMESYKDDWLLWDQLIKMKGSDLVEDRERWQADRTKRMLLWIHLSSDDQKEWCYRSHWWKAKQRASVAWVVQKAHKNKVPSDIEDPYYKDYEGQERLKPGIVHRLSNADLYCSALANIYGDPNFHNLSHWNIIQALARKGVYVAEPSDVALTETVLIQTTPIKVSAHLAVIEAMMSLYIREVVIAERVVQAIQRISGLSHSQEVPTPQDQEEALVLWVDSITQALQARIHQHIRPSQGQELPIFPKIQDLSDLSDGIGLATLIAYYCPQELSWEDIAVADPPSMADSLYNVGLVVKFCHESLPYNPCLLSREDIVYMHSSVKQNILAFIAELFFLMELEPVSCVSISNTKKSSKFIQLSSPGIKPAGVPSATNVRRSHSMTMNDSPDMRYRSESRSENAPSSQNSDYGGRESSMSDGQEGEFLVQRAKGYSTLSDMMKAQSSRSSYNSPENCSSRGNPKERYNVDSKEEELGERRLSRRGSFYDSSQELNALPAAGLPSRLDQRPVGRSRSRRNSISAEESQLTIENFGGSQENLNYISRNPDKEPYIHSGKLDGHPVHPRRSMSQTREDNFRINDLHKSSMDELDNRIIDKLEKEALEREKIDWQHSNKELSKSYGGKKDNNNAAVDTSSESDASNETTGRPPTSFAELSKIKDQLPGGINIIYMQPERDDSNHKSHSKDKKTSFAALPNQTTWKQQSVQSHAGEDNYVMNDEMEPHTVSSELYNVKLKLEEKRRRIEAEKRKMELMANKHRQKLGQEAFMQAVVKGDLGTEVSNVSQKWLQGDGGEGTDELRTPDMEAMDYDEYHRSLSQMTDSLTEIQGDIQRLSHQQHQIQSMMMHNGTPSSSQQQQQHLPHHHHHGPPQQPQHQNQFYLHDQQQQGMSRRMWNQQPMTDGYSSISPAARRAQWGPVRPMMPQNEYMMGGPPQSSPYYSYQMMQPPPVQLPPMSQVGQPLNQNQGPAPPGYMLHGQTHSLPPGHHQQNVYQNGQNAYGVEQYKNYPNQNYEHLPRVPPPSQQGGHTPFRLHTDSSEDRKHSMQPHGPPHPPPRHQKSPSPGRQVMHAPVSAPPPDDMAPQNVSFIDSDESDKFKRLSISSGSRTYRIPREPGSPTRPVLSSGTKTYRVPTKKGSTSIGDSEASLQHQQHATSPDRGGHPPYSQAIDDGSPSIKVEPLSEGPKGDQGFYISLEDDRGPKRPKPPLRTKKLSQRKKSSSPATPQSTPTREDLPPISDRSSAVLSGNQTDDAVPFSSSEKFQRNFGSRFQSPRNNNNNSTYSTTYSTRNNNNDLNSNNNNIYSSPASPSTHWSPQSNAHHHHGNFDQTGIVDLNNTKNLRNNNSNQNNNVYGDHDDDSPREFDDSGSGFTSDANSSGRNNFNKRRLDSSTGLALVINDDSANIDDSSVSEMEKKKERLMMMSMRRKQLQEEARRQKEMEAEARREQEKAKEESRQRKKDEEKARRQLILERHKIKKAIEEAEKGGQHYVPPAWYLETSGSTTPNSKSSSVRMRNRGSGASKPRPKTMHEASSYTDSVSSNNLGAQGKRGSSSNISGGNASSSSSSTFRKNRWGSSGTLARSSGNRGSTGSIGAELTPNSGSRTLDRHSGRRPASLVDNEGGSLMRRARSKGSMLLYGSRGAGLDDGRSYQVHESRRPTLANSSSSRYRSSSRSGTSQVPRGDPRRYRSTGNLYGNGDHESLLYHMSEDSGLGRSTPPRRVPSPGMSSRHLTSPNGPGSLPPGLFYKKRPGGGPFDDNMSDISTASSNLDYCGPRLFKQPTSKSNRTIIINAVEHCVFPGVVNETAKRRVLEEMSRSDAKYFLVLFRDSGCQFRALYTYDPDTEDVFKLCGTGPKLITDRMFEKFFKYNSGGKCFSQIHTKHLTVTIDAFTIHNSLWQGKRVNLPSKKDMKLVI